MPSHLLRDQCQGCWCQLNYPKMCFHLPWLCPTLVKTHRYQKSLNRLLKICHVPATCTILLAFFFAAAITSTNEADKAACARR
jgi:hypothetical protein